MKRTANREIRELFCAPCQVCTQVCPPGAIAPNKQMMRGIVRWYVNFDKCIPGFVEAGFLRHLYRRQSLDTPVGSAQAAHDACRKN